MSFLEVGWSIVYTLFSFDLVVLSSASNMTTFTP